WPCEVSASSKMRAWVSLRAGPAPTETSCSNCARSSAAKVTRYVSIVDLLLLRGAQCSIPQETGSRFTRQSKIDVILAQNIGWLNKLRWIMETSLLKTLAGKHRTSAARMSRRYRAVVQTEAGPRPCLEVRVEREGKSPLVARFGGLPLRRKK